MLYKRTLQGTNQSYLQLCKTFTRDGWSDEVYCKNIKGG